MGSFFSLLILVADIWAIMNVVQSRASTGGKVLWTAMILVLPAFGFIIWFMVGPRRMRF